MSDEQSAPLLLSDHQQRDFAEYSALLSLWEGAYPYALFSYVGFKDKQGTYLLFGRIILLPSCADINTAEFRFETEHIIAERFIVNKKAFSALSILENAKAGQICDLNNVSIAKLRGNPNFSVFFHADHHPLVSEGPGIMPCIQFQGVSPFQLTSDEIGQKQLNWELNAADRPFDNLEELLVHCAFPFQAQMRDSTVLEIMVSPPGYIGQQSIIKEGTATIDCHISAGLDTRRMKLGYRIFQKDLIERACVLGNDIKWERAGDFNIGRYQFSVKDAPFVQAILSYGGIPFYRWVVSDPQKIINFRHAIHQMLDDKLELLRAMLLKPRQDQSDIFESAFSTLLGLLGFSTLDYGLNSKFSRGPDIIAMTPAGKIAVIECTLGLPDHKSKLAKVAERTMLIKEKLSQAGFNFLQVQPAVVTPLTREAIKANWQDAAKHSIALICQEDIEELLRRVFLLPDPDKLFSEVGLLIPQADL